MRKKIRIVLEKIGYRIANLGKILYLSKQEKRVIPWFCDEGDKTLRLNYDLDKKSVVIDLGGYEGQWASDIFSKYCCFIHVFEPELQFANNIKTRFKSNKKITVHHFGLSNKTIESEVTLLADGTSMFKKGGETTKISLVKAIDFFNEQSIGTIDLMKINIEGGEYDLLDHLLESGFISRIKNIQIQFHDFVPNAEQRMFKTQQKLVKTHQLSYQYLFVWENWVQK